MLSRLLALTLIALLLSGCPLEGDDGIAGLRELKGSEPFTKSNLVSIGM